MARPREGIRVLFVEAPAELAERLRALAKRNHRSMNGEALVALERHLEAEGAPRIHPQKAPPPEGKPTKCRGKKGGGR